MSPVAVRLKHISRFRDRHGVLRHYLRIPGRKPVALPGLPGSAEFMARYNAEVAAAAGATAPPEPPRLPPGSLDALAVSYYASDAYKGLRTSTQRAYRRIVEELRSAHGDKPIKLLDAEGVRLLLEEKGRPTAANHRLRLLRALMAHAVERKWLAADPTLGVKRRRYRTDGYATWSEAEIAQYEAHWPPGSKARLALTLLLYTGQRRSDVVRMGRQHLRAEGIDVRQVKTGHRLTIPVHPTLAAELALARDGRLTFLATDAGPGFTPAGFYQRFREWCDAAKIPAGRSPHGLRKACGRRLAEAGCTAHQIMAVLGLRTLALAEVYTRAAEQTRLARDGMARISNPAGKVGNRRAKRS
jgi:integrase